MNKIYTVHRIALNDNERVRRQSFGWMETVNSQLFCSEFDSWFCSYYFLPQKPSICVEKTAILTIFIELTLKRSILLIVCFFFYS